MKAAPPEHQQLEEEAQERAAPPGEVVYKAIYQEGEHEMNRPVAALAWSGLAAGLSMGFSFVAESVLRHYLPEAPWTPALIKAGYSIGFLIVILGRQQLFTKNTLTVMLPLFDRRTADRLTKVGRLWGVVLFTNLLGAFCFAWLLARTAAFDPEVRHAMGLIAAETPAAGFWPILLRAVLAGWLIALMVWLLPFAETARLWVIIILAYLVGLAGLPHIIAGSVPAFYLVLTAQRTLSSCVLHFLVPTLLGNIIGGVALVAAGAHAELAPTAGANS